MYVLALGFVSRLWWAVFTVFWCFIAQRIVSPDENSSGSLVRNSLSVSACKNVRFCLFFYTEEKIQRDPERDSDFHFSVHRPTMRGVFPVSVTCYLTDAAAGICCSRVGQLEEDGRRRTAERRCATCWSSASHDSSALWPVNRRVAAGAFTQSVHIHFVSPVHTHTHTHTHTMTRTQWHTPTHPHTSWVCSSLEVLISYCWAAVKSVSSSVCTIIFEPIPVFIY